MREKLVSIAVFAVFLGAWETVFKNIYIQSLGASGGVWGFSTATLGYAVLLGSATITAWVINRKLRGEAK